MRPRTTTLASLACAAGLALAGLAGCGDDDSALSAEEFIAQADRICADGNARIGAAVPEGPRDGPPSGPEAEAFYEVMVDETERQIAAVDALAAPDAMKADVEELLAVAREAVSTLRSTPAAEYLAQRSNPFAPVSAKAREIGLAECAGE